MRLILLGPPAAGKGTQAVNLSEKYNIPAISTGEMIRAEIAKGSDLGKKAQNLINGGKLLPDEIIVDMVRVRIKEDDCKAGFILDGFPRTVKQAEAAEKLGIAVDKVILIEVSDSDIVARISGRRHCENCKKG